MRTFVVLLVVAILTFAQSCNSEKTEEISEDAVTSDLSASETVLPLVEKDFPQEWKLSMMSGMIANSETSGEDMEYQETYRFFPNKTFTKIREKNESVSEASGTFDHIKTGTGEEYFKLSYPEKHELIENCDGGKEEWLSKDQEKILRGTANACDHPTKTYKRT